MRHLNGSCCSTTSEDGDGFLNAYVAPSPVSGIAYDERSQSTRKRCAGWGVDVGSQSCDGTRESHHRGGPMMSCSDLLKTSSDGRDRELHPC